VKAAGQAPAPKAVRLGDGPQPRPARRADDRWLVHEPLRLLDHGYEFAAAGVLVVAAVRGHRDCEPTLDHLD
jgi:hypothetical protein